MPFDPNQPFEVISEPQTESPVIGFDPSQPFEVVPPTAQQQSINDFIASRQAGPISKIGTGISGLLNTFIKEPAIAAYQTAQQIPEILDRNLVVPEGESRLKTSLLSLLPFGRATPELAQTGVEAGSRALFGLGNALDQLISKSGANVSRAIDNPLQTAIQTAIPGLNVAQQLLPSTPSQEDINQFLADQLRAKQVEAVTSQPLVPEVLGPANIPLAKNLQTLAEVAPIVPPIFRATARGVAAIPSAIKTTAKAITSPRQTLAKGVSIVAPETGAKMTERLASASLDDVTNFSLGLDTAEKQAAISVRVPTAVERTLETTGGKVPKTAEGIVKEMDRTETRLYQDRLNTNKIAEERGLGPSADRALEEAEEAINSQPNLSQAKKEAQIQELRDTEAYRGQKTASEGQTIQQTLNGELSDAYRNDTIDRLSLVGKRAFRDSMARQMDEISQIITGRVDTPYADIGSLIEVRGNLQDRLGKLKYGRAKERIGSKEGQPSIPVTKKGAISKGGKQALKPFVKTEIELLDESAVRMFSEQPARPPVLPPEQGAINELLQSYSPSGTALTADMERQIQALIKTFPQAIRSDPYLARRYAERALAPNVAP